MWKEKAAALNALGRYAEALAASERAIELAAVSVEAWEHKVAALHGLGREAEACEAEQQIPSRWRRSRQVRSGSHS